MPSFLLGRHTATEYAPALPFQFSWSWCLAVPDTLAGTFANTLSLGCLQHLLQYLPSLQFVLESLADSTQDSWLHSASGLCPATSLSLKVRGARHPLRSSCICLNIAIKIMLFPDDSERGACLSDEPPFTDCTRKQASECWGSVDNVSQRGYHACYQVTSPQELTPFQPQQLSQDNMTSHE